MKIQMRATTLVALSLVTTLGCNSVPKINPVEIPLISQDKDIQKQEKKIDYGVPESMAVIWTDSAYTQAGSPSIRGFGGRFFFYDTMGEAIPVEGELVIYGFDDSDDLQQRKEADRKFVFRQSELQSHASENDLGLSYSFWVPWDEIGGIRTTVSLLPIFKTSEGKTIRGEMSVNVLPGRTPDEVQGEFDGVANVPYADSDDMGSRQVGFNQRIDRNYDPIQDDSVNRTQMKTTTIEVPRGLGRQLQTPQAPRARRSTSQNSPQTPVARLEIEQRSPIGGDTRVGTGEAPGLSRLRNQGDRFDGPRTKSSQ